MKKTAAILALLALTLALCACTHETNPPAPGGDTPPTQVSYPFLDDAGYYHYRLYLNGEPLSVGHDALLRVEDNKNNELLYPLSAVLDHFGVAYYWDKQTDDFSTVINGVNVSRDCGDEHFMWFSNQTDGYGNGMVPGNINGVFYAPNYAFEHTIGAKLTKIKKGDELLTDRIEITVSEPFSWGAGSASAAVMRWNGSRYVGDAGNPGGTPGGNPTNPKTCGSCGGTGRITCSACGGSGTAWNNQMVYDPVSGTMKSQTVMTTCWSCGGARGRVCSSCGGDGRVG